MRDIQSHLIIHNVSKEANFGFLIRTANALGANIVVVGRKHYGKTGAVGGTRRTPVNHFLTLREAVTELRSNGCSIVGVEIMPEAKPIGTLPFVGSTAFMFGNEGEGLNLSQQKLCDSFVYVPQFGTATCMNVNSATAIVLHRFAEWAGFDEAPRMGTRFATYHEQKIDRQN